MTTKQAGLEEAKTGMAALEVVNEHGEIVSWEEFGQWEDFGIDDLQPKFPLIKIATGVSRMTGASKHGGEFWHSDREGDDDEFTESLDVVLLVRLRTRALFEAGSDKPVCMSYDAIAPAEDMSLWTKDRVKVRDGEGTKEINVPLSQAPAKCALCPFSQWGPNNTRPVCGDSDVYLVDRGAGDLAQLRVSGVNLSPIRDFIQRRVVPKKIPPFNFRLHLETVEKQREGKRWHEITVGATRLPADEAMTYANILAQRREAFASHVRESTGDGVEWADAVDVSAADSGWETE